MAVRFVFLDAGETLFDETSLWEGWARWLQVPPLTLFALLGAVIAGGEDHRAAFQIIRPGFDIDAERRAREAAGDQVGFGISDFYPDALPCLAELSARGFRVGVAGNTGRDVEIFLREHTSVDFVGSSASFGVEKPSREFFDRLCELAGAPAGQVAYVGDRVDNDVMPAAEAGMVAVHIRRGPWGYLHAGRPEARVARLRIAGLGELAPALSSLSGGEDGP